MLVLVYKNFACVRLVWPVLSICMNPFHYNFMLDGLAVLWALEMFFTNMLNIFFSQEGSICLGSYCW